MAVYHSHAELAAGRRARHSDMAIPPSGHSTTPRAAQHVMCRFARLSGNPIRRPAPIAARPARMVVARSARDRLVQPAVRPAQRGLDHAVQIAPLGREPVFDAHGCIGNHSARDDALRLQLFQPLREHAVADVGDGIAQLAKACQPLHQGADDRPGPAPADQFHGVVIVRAEGLAAVGWPTFAATPRALDLIVHCPPLLVRIRVAGRCHPPLAAPRLALATRTNYKYLMYPQCASPTCRRISPALPGTSRAPPWPLAALARAGT